MTTTHKFPLQPCNQEEEEDPPKGGRGLLHETVDVSPFQSDEDDEDDDDEGERSDQVEPEEEDNDESLDILKRLRSVNLSGMKEKKGSLLRTGRMRLKGLKGLRRSRSWQGFENGLRYRNYIPL